MSLNKVMLIGNLGRDPELRHTAKNFAVCTLNLATTEKQKDSSGNWVDHTEWHRVSVFGKTAENCAKYLAKGRQIYVEGKIRTRKYTDKAGVEKYSTEILADTIQFIGGKPAGNNSNREYSSGGSAAPVTEERVMDLPSADDMSSAGAIQEDDIPF